MCMAISGYRSQVQDCSYLALADNAAAQIFRRHLPTLLVIGLRQGVRIPQCQQPDVRSEAWLDGLDLRTGSQACG